MSYWEDYGDDDEDKWFCPHCGAGDTQPCEEWCQTNRPANEPDNADDGICTYVTIT